MHYSMWNSLCRYEMHYVDMKCTTRYEIHYVHMQCTTRCEIHYVDMKCTMSIWNALLDMKFTMSICNALLDVKFTIAVCPLEVRSKWKLTMWVWWVCNTLQHTATHCNTLQHTAKSVVKSCSPLLKGPLDMGWLRLVGSFKLQVSFAEYSLFYRALLQKRPIILRSLLIVATPYEAHIERTLHYGKWL